MTAKKAAKKDAVVDHTDASETVAEVVQEEPTDHESHRGIAPEQQPVTKVWESSTRLIVDRRRS